MYGDKKTHVQHKRCHPRGLPVTEDGVTNLAWRNSEGQDYLERKKQRAFQAEGTAEAKAQGKNSDLKQTYRAGV